MNDSMFSRENQDTCKKNQKKRLERCKNWNLKRENVFLKHLENPNNNEMWKHWMRKQKMWEPTSVTQRLRRKRVQIL